MPNPAPPKRLPSLRRFAASLLAACLASPAALAADAPGPDDLLMAGDEQCTRCHNDVSDGIVEDTPILPIGRGRHGVTADARTPGCTGCHGESKAHAGEAESGRRRGPRPLPDLPFGRQAAASARAHNAACLGCHAGDRLMHWNGSIHARRDVPCSGCHRLHAAHDPATTREALPGLCMSCHKEKRAQFAKPSHHPVPEGQMVCTDCHNPHGSAGPKLMLRDSVNDTCYSCHMEYRGPFLWQHQPVTQSCVLCHNPHGTVTANLLKLRPPFLCQQCHEPTSHRGSFASIDGANANVAGAGGVTQARGCPNCHTNIHGGNNPSNAGTSGSSRAFRR